MFDTKDLRDYSLTSKNILKLVDEETLFRYYCPVYDGTSKKFSSELRRDNNPSCTIKHLQSGVRYRDHAEGYSANIFDYIQRKFSTSFIEALNIINTDFKLNLGYGKPKESVQPSMGFFGLPDLKKEKKEIKRSTIKVKVRNWNQKDKTFWFDKYYIDTKLLKKYQVYPLSHYCINDSWFYKPEFCYGYYCQEEEWKIYQPFDKNFKFFNNISPDFYCGYNQLPKEGDRLIITSSRKDVLCWALFGYSAISPQSEVQVIKKEFLYELQQRFDKVYINFDNDLTGQREAEKYNLDKIFTPEYKDLSDTLEYKRYDYTKELIKKMLNE